jgi:hypothetical protein
MKHFETWMKRREMALGLHFYQVKTPPRSFLKKKRRDLEQWRDVMKTITQLFVGLALLLPLAPVGVSAGPDLTASFEHHSTAHSIGSTRP